MGIRLAVEADLGTIHELDAEAFPPGDDDREPAAPGELLKGVVRGQTLVAERGGEIVAFLQYDVIGTHTPGRDVDGTDNIDLISLAVRGTERASGIGGGLVDHFLDTVKKEHPGSPITAVTSPRNVDMLRLLLRKDFVATTAVPNYFGAGKDRIYCQYGFRLPAGSLDDRIVVPVGAIGYVIELVGQDDHVITKVLDGAQGHFFEICRTIPEDRSSLMSGEAAISVSEVGAVLAGFTFLLGLSFVIPDFSTALRVMILFATVLTTGSLAIFANSSGNLARIRDNAFDQHMKWANLLLEFGGLYPLAIVLSAVFVHFDNNALLSFGVGVVVAALIACYEYSPFSLSHRYRRSWLMHLAIVLTIALPITSTPLYFLTGSEAPWAFAVAVVLAFRLTLHIPNGRAETAIERRGLFRSAERRPDA